jgi:hypothetical protein
VSGNPDIQPTWQLLLKTEKVDEILPFFIVSNSDHVGWRSELPDTILEGDHPPTIPTTFGLKWPIGFRGEYVLVIVDERTEILFVEEYTMCASPYIFF